MYLVDVMLFADNRKWEKGTGICGIILWNEELGKDEKKKLSGMGMRVPQKQGGRQVREQGSS